MGTNFYDFGFCEFVNLKSQFREDFIWYGKLFQTLGPVTLNFLLPKVTWLCTDIFKISIYFSQTSLLVSLKLKRSFIK